MATVWHEDGRAMPLPGDDLREVAAGMLDARRTMRGTLPAALIDDVPLEMLLALFVAHPRDLGIAELLAEQSTPPRQAQRWLAAVAAEQMVALTGGSVALTDHGHDAMTAMLCKVVSSQRLRLGWANH